MVKYLTIFLIKLKFGNVGFLGEGKTGVPQQRLSRIIFLLFNTLITKQFYCTANEITAYIAGYVLTTDDECSVQHDHIWAVLL